jgi:hypothetical protein
MLKELNDKRRISRTDANSTEGTRKIPFL